MMHCPMSNISEVSSETEQLFPPVQKQGDTLQMPGSAACYVDVSEPEAHVREMQGD